MKNAVNKDFLAISKYFLHYFNRRKILHFLLTVMCFSSLAFCEQTEDILCKLQQKKVTVNYSAKIQIVIKTPFGAEQVFYGEQTVSGDNCLTDFSQQKGFLFLKTATADYRFSADGVTQDVSDMVVNSDYTLEKMIKNYRFQLMNISDSQVILTGFSQDRQIGDIRLYIDKPEYLLRKIEINKENSDESILVENSYFQNIIKNQKITVSSAGIVVGIEISYSDLVINPALPKDFFENKRLISLIKNAKENAHE